MSERYVRLFSLPKELYVQGAPILIVAGALLKDTHTDHVLAQLKLQNLSEETLIACKVSIRTFDPSGAELPGVENHSYLDLSVMRGQCFGTQEPIIIPDNTTRSITVSVTQVVFRGGAVWQGSDDAWVSIFPNHQHLSEVLRDSELQKQYSLEVGRNCDYAPTRCGDLFLCACGAVNLLESGKCSACRRDFEKLTAALELDTLTKKKNARLEKEAVERTAAEEAAAREGAERAKARAEKEAKARARNKKIALIAAAAAVAAVFTIAITTLVTKVIIPAKQYSEAEELLAAGNYDEAFAAFSALGDYKGASEQVLASRYMKAESLLMDSNNQAEAAMAFGSLGDYKDSRERCFALWSKVVGREMISAGNNHTVALKSDGTVVATGKNDDNQCNVQDWTDIVAVCVGEFHTVGLKSDGNVVAVGSNGFDQCDVQDWNDIVAISAGNTHTVALKSDGTVVATGNNNDSQCDVQGWTDIVAVSAGGFHTIGLKSNGTVVATGHNKYGECNVRGWTDIITISAGGWNTAGLKSDGTVVAVGSNVFGQCEVQDWTDIVAVSVGFGQTVGLKSDRTVVAEGEDTYSLRDVRNWADIVAISAGGNRTVAGLKSDGSLVATNDNKVCQWTGIKMPNR